MAGDHNEMISMFSYITKLYSSVVHGSSVSMLHLAQLIKLSDLALWGQSSTQTIPGGTIPKNPSKTKLLAIFFMSKKESFYGMNYVTLNKNGHLCFRMAAICLPNEHTALLGQNSWKTRCTNTNGSDPLLSIISETLYVMLPQKVVIFLPFPVDCCRDILICHLFLPIIYALLSMCPITLQRPRQKL